MKSCDRPSRGSHSYRSLLHPHNACLSRALFDCVLQCSCRHVQIILCHNRLHTRQVGTYRQSGRCDTTAFPPATSPFQGQEDGLRLLAAPRCWLRLLFGPSALQLAGGPQILSTAAPCVFPQEVLNAMTHELIHAYDDCRLAPPQHGGTRGTHSSTTSASASDAPSRAGDTLAGEVACAGATPTGAQTSGAESVESEHAGGSSRSSSCSVGPGRGVQGASCMGGVDWSDCRQHACTEVSCRRACNACLLSAGRPGMAVELGMTRSVRICVLSSASGRPRDGPT